MGLGLNIQMMLQSLMGLQLLQLDQVRQPHFIIIVLFILEWAVQYLLIKTIG